MKTHISNTKAKELYLDIMGKTVYEKHQQKINSDNIKPCVVTRRKQEVKITNNNKKQINQNPNQHVNHLFKNLHQNKYKSTIDNHVPKNYESGKKILKDKIKKNRYENAAKKDHLKELEVQANKIKNCKTITQRKKDKTDPIVNPTYFMRDASHAESVTIQNYKNKILKMNKPVSSHDPANYQFKNTFKMESQPIFDQFQQSQVKFGKVPNYTKPTKQRPASAKVPPSRPMKQNRNQQNDDLPECNFKAMLNHIVENKMWKDTDMKVLYVRLCHRYGENRVDEIWDILMDELEK